MLTSKEESGRGTDRARPLDQIWSGSIIWDRTMMYCSRCISIVARVSRFFSSWCASEIFSVARGVAFNFGPQ
jgi:hypothetical protein